VTGVTAVTAVRWRGGAGTVAEGEEEEEEEEEEEGGRHC
jgi:hypothetical protein